MRVAEAHLAFGLGTMPTCCSGQTRRGTQNHSTINSKPNPQKTPTGRKIEVQPALGGRAVKTAFSSSGEHLPENTGTPIWGADHTCSPECNTWPDGNCNVTLMG